MSHYNYLEEHLPAFFEALGINWKNHVGIITAHGDKCYSWEDKWEEAGIPFAHGVAIYLLSYCQPYSQEVRDTPNGWVAPQDWVVKNAPRFVHLLPPINHSH